MSESLFGRMSNVEVRSVYAQQRLQGVQHRRRLSPGSPAAGQQPVASVIVGPELPVDEVVCLVTAPEAAVVPLYRVKIEWDLLLWGYYEVWEGALPANPAGSLVRYQIRAHDEDSGEYYWADDGAEYSYLVGDSGPPAWALPTIVYQVFPDRFSPGSGRNWNSISTLSDIHGGTLRGIIDHLDYIANLGFTTIWLNPFFPDKTHHGYHATDYFAVNPRLGTNDDMRELVDQAHERGLRLLLDFVGNHWGSNHATFQAALSDRNSPYYDWYFWKKWPEEYLAYYNVPDLPKLNVNHPGVRDHLLRSVGYWLGEVGFDGLRLDHADGPTFDFWTDVRAVARSIKSDAWMFGEMTLPPDQQLVYAGLFDGTLDFLLCQAMRGTFGLGTMNLATFDAFLNRHEAFFPPNTAFSRPSFLDNHDMDRFLWLAKEDKRKLKLAALVQFTLSGAPIVYNGTEAGVTQSRSIHEAGSQGMEECRQPMLWGDEQDGDLYSYFWYLAHLRRDHPALWRGTRRTIHLDSTAQTYAYVREDGLDSVAVGINMSDQPRRFVVPYVDRGTVLTFDLPPWSGDVAVV
ncbi:MAG: alpha-amylase family glycosyl hydrolase [Chloroflexota bacterium]|jgi:cyclomaltodextrinase / maltogenic alpha-amylase / neopullulanase